MSELHTAEQLHGSDVQWSTLKCWQHDDIYRASSSVLVLPRQYDLPIQKPPCHVYPCRRETSQQRCAVVLFKCRLY
jgi:hypothetical protein